MNPFLPLLTRTVLIDSMQDVPASGMVREFVQCAWRLPILLGHMNGDLPFMLNNLQPFLCGVLFFFLSAAVLSAINTTYFRLILQGNNFQYNLVVNSLQAFGYSLKLFAANLGRPEPLK